MKKKILFYGEHPFGFTGNGNMMCITLAGLDSDKYEAICQVVGTPEPALYDPFKPMPFNLINGAQPDDNWGLQQLLNTLYNTDIDVFVTIGIDIWRLYPIIKHLKKILNEKRIVWASVMPYDSDKNNQDWFDLMNLIDYPFIYSEFGYKMAKDKVKNVAYYRPDLFGRFAFNSYTKEQTSAFVQSHFTSVGEDPFMFGFVGGNQVRKEPHKVLKAFLNTYDHFEGKRNVCLYMHTEAQGVYNLKDLGTKWGVKDPNKILFKRQGTKYPLNDIALMYNNLDCLVLPSVQEGLSWTPLEAMLCKTMVLVSDTTAHKELVSRRDCFIPCKETVMVPVPLNKSEFTHLEAKGCSIEDLTDAMINVVNMDNVIRQSIINDNHKEATRWLEGVNFITDTLDKIVEERDAVIELRNKKNDKILFMQHSSGGDVFMTTRCFKGLKARHPGKKLDYMTMPQFMGIVEHNPYLNEILAWDEKIVKEYEAVYNPHGERILPGNWGRNANSILADFYWKILKVEPDDFCIIPDGNLPDWVIDPLTSTHKPVCIVHTTGGDPQFRIYKYMSEVCEAIEDTYFTVQVGGQDDYPAGAEMDLRGQLSYRQTAYLMQMAYLAITVDSFVSHLAGAMGVNQIALYGSGNAAVCQPKQVEGTLIALSPDYIRFCPGLGPCSASIRNCPVPCTGLHSPEDILSAIDKIERGE